MQNLSPRHIETKESTRLGVQSGWYGTKVSGTFVTGPHATEADCRRQLAQLDAPTMEGKALKATLPVRVRKKDQTGFITPSGAVSISAGTRPSSVKTFRRLHDRAVVEAC